SLTKYTRYHCPSRARVAQNAARDCTRRSNTASGSGQTLVPETKTGARLQPYTTSSTSRADVVSLRIDPVARSDSTYGLSDEMNGSVFGSSITRTTIHPRTAPLSQIARSARRTWRSLDPKCEISSTTSHAQLVAAGADDSYSGRLSAKRLTS